ncbi:MAG: T9SS type A sorting domain-containing protein [Chitinophagaceae bacterium]
MFLSHSESAKATIVPSFNPAVNELHFKGITEGSKFAIVDMSGSVVFGSKTDASNSVDIHNLIPGYYVIRLVTPEHSAYILKFTKS